MRGVVLAGGTGSRLSPLTETINKHMLPVGREPMIWHSVRQLASAGIEDITIVTSPHHLGAIGESLGSGQRFGVRLGYALQEQAGGIADALRLAQNFGPSDRVTVLLGDNIFEHSIASHVEAYRRQRDGARILLKTVDDPERYGVALVKGERVIDIEEKPPHPKSRDAVVGCYMYDEAVWEILSHCTPSDRGELEITAVNNAYLARGTLAFGRVEGGWTDAGTFSSLHDANALLLSNDNELLP
ncbi:MAG: NTP transferase domain-containing protein [Gammaproteobacteria bacterium]|nr:NTP transferase domain-containing protein [Gammaproteobacteria bacterium]